MKSVITTSVLALMVGSLISGGMANAQPTPQPSHSGSPHSQPASQPDKPGQPARTQHDDRDSNGWHRTSDVRKGGHMSRNDWKRSKAVDYRKHKRLSAPPKGYQWRQLDGRFVLTSKTNGTITTIIIK